MPFIYGPRLYTDNEIVVSTTVGSTQDRAREFGFVANRLRIWNRQAATVYVDFQSTAPLGSTSGLAIKTLEQFSLDGVALSGLTLASTTTSTAASVAVAAMRG